VIRGRARPISVWLFSLSILGLLPLIVFAGWLIVSNAERDRAMQIAQIQQTTRALIQAIDERFESRMALLQGLTTSAALRDGRLDEFRFRALEAVKKLSEGSGIIVTDRSGRQLLSTFAPPGSPLTQRTDMEPVIKVFETRRPWISNLFSPATGGRLFVSVDVPVFGLDDVVIYDVALGIPLEELNGILEEQKLRSTWFAGVLDRNGMLAARVPHPELYVGKPAALLLREGVKQTAEGTVETPTLENVDVVSTWSRSQRTGWAVAVAMPQSEFVGPMRFQMFALLSAGAVALAISAALAFTSGRTIAVRLAALADRAEVIGSGRNSHVPKPGIKEIDVVNTAMANADAKIRDQEQHLRLLIAELDHRVKNMLANVQAIAMRTFGRSPDAKTFSGRIAALASAHSLLSKTEGRGSSLRPLVEGALVAHGDVAGRVHIEGPDIFLTPKVTQRIALALHELTTNAAKYGALSSPSGSVRITWDSTNGSQSRLHLRWSEQGGPPVVAPNKRGFGSFLIDNLGVDLDGVARLEFPPQGVVFTLDVALKHAAAETVVSTQPVRITSTAPSLAADSRVLVIEDELLAGMQLSDILAQAGLQVSLARSVEQGAGIIAAEHFDAAVLDVNVDGEMVFPVARSLKTRGTPFVFLTGYGTPEIWPIDLRDERRLNKPVITKELYEALGIHHVSL
jgi:two-component sensor histidine kinase